MLMYNLLEKNQTSSITSGSLQNYYKDEIDGVDGKSFEYKTKLVKKTPERPAKPGLDAQ